MKIFLDTASLKDIGWAAQAGLIDGVHQPVAARQAGGRPRPQGRAQGDLLARRGPGVGRGGGGGRGRDGAGGAGAGRIADHIVVKVPMLEAGLVAVRRLAAEGIKTNVTLCFSSPQCLLAAKAGASY